MNTDNFLIEENDIELARNICGMITDEGVRNRAVANALGANIAEKFFDSELYKVDTESGLHNIGIVLDDIDISDIYVNNSYIDVRLFFDDGQLCIPKSHFDKNLVPLAYMFIKITPDLSGAGVVGFILSENVDKSNLKDDLYFINEEDLISFYDVESCIITSQDLCNVEDKEIFSYLDNKLEDKDSFYRKLIASQDGRLKLARAAKAKLIFNFVSAPNVEDESENVEVYDDSENSSLDFGLDLETSGEDGNNFLEAHEEDILELQDDSSTEDEFEVLSEGDDFYVADSENYDLDGNNEELTIDENIEADNSYDIEVDTGETLDSDFADNDAGFTVDEELPSEVESLELEEQADFTPTVEDNDIIEDTRTVEAIEDEDLQDNSFEFTTTASPSIETIESTYEELLNEDEDAQEPPISEEQKASSIEESVDDASEAAPDNSEQLEALFYNGEGEVDSEEADMLPQKKKSSGSTKIIAVAALLVVLGALGYFGYTKFMPLPSVDEDSKTNVIADNNQDKNEQPINKKEDSDIANVAMPIETVESTEPIATGNEGSATSIPTIEQNLDASILVSNLKIDWEVPAGYASNTSAKRYLVKLGKIIQLNLKTELLLLNKPPLTNKIAVEIKYNDSSKKFETVGIVTSSGEELVDNLIKQTVDKALSMNLNMNTNSFSKLQGNPILIIHL